MSKPKAKSAIKASVAMGPKSRSDKTKPTVQSAECGSIRIEDGLGEFFATSEGDLAQRVDSSFNPILAEEVLDEPCSPPHEGSLFDLFNPPLSELDESVGLRIDQYGVCYLEHPCGQDMKRLMEEISVEADNIYRQESDKAGSVAHIAREVFGLARELIPELLVYRNEWLAAKFADNGHDFPLCFTDAEKQVRVSARVGELVNNVARLAFETGKAYGRLSLREAEQYAASGRASTEAATKGGRINRANPVWDWLDRNRPGWRGTGGNITWKSAYNLAKSANQLNGLQDEESFRVKFYAERRKCNARA